MSENKVDPSAPVLKNSTVTALIWERYTITDKDGRPATFAIIDEEGRVLDAGPEVAQEIWDLAILSYRQYLMGEGVLRIYSPPPKACCRIANNKNGHPLGGALVHGAGLLLADCLGHTTPLRGHRDSRIESVRRLPGYRELPLLPSLMLAIPKRGRCITVRSSGDS